MIITIRDEFIKLQQALQLCGACSSGAEAKYEILEGNVFINGEPELRRGKKMHDGESFVFRGVEYKVVSEE